MHCQCGIDFCYVCGEQAAPGSDHWLRETSGCPRFGVAGSEQEMFDDDLGGPEDGADDDTELMEVWEQGEGEATKFDFIRWAWQAAMAEGTAYA